MAVGFVLIRAESGKEQAVYQALLKVAEIAEVVPLFGEYDLIAKVRADDMDELGQIILESIRTLPGIAATKTLAAAKL